MPERGPKKDFVNFEKEVREVSGLDDCSQNLFKEHGIISPSNQDEKINQNGNDLLELCKSFDLKIVNGRVGDDKNIGNFTCHKPSGKSVVDYAVVSDCLAPHIVNFNVDMFDKSLSDVHCPISLCLTKPEQDHMEKISKPRQIQTTKIKFFKNKWKEIGS